MLATDMIERGAIKHVQQEEKQGNAAHLKPSVSKLSITLCFHT
jgi:hypothetical protein